MAKKFDFLSPGIELREVDNSFIPAGRDAEGPIIIGRTRKGPANTPVKVRNLDDFVSVFGTPVPGGSGDGGDVWREGNTIGPTYAAYAAQAWLASEEAPIVMVRLAGEQHASANAPGYAGWQVGDGGVTTELSTNETAYGLFMMDAGDAAAASVESLTLSVTASNDDATMKGLSGSLPGVVLSASLGDAGLAGVAVAFIFDFSGSLSGPTAYTGLSGHGGNSGSTTAIGIPVHNVKTRAELMTNLEAGFEYAAANSYLTGAFSAVAFSDGAGTDRLDITNYDTSLTMNFTASHIDFALGASDTCFLATGSFSLDGYDKDLARVDVYGPHTIPVGSSPGQPNTGSLAAVFYSTAGGLALRGLNLDGLATTTSSVGELLKSDGANGQMTLDVYNASGVRKERATFNFDRNSGDYIRNVLNTNPQLTNSDTTAADDLKTYWLGETFERSVNDFVDISTSATGEVYGILLPLGAGTTSATSWGYQRKGARKAKSGWVISQKSTGQEKIFRIISLHVGEEVQKEYMIAIEDIKEAANPLVNPYGTFTLAVKDMAGSTVEKYTGLNLNPAHPNYIAKRIGDQYQTWSDTDRRYRTYGDFPNLSDIIYVEMAENVANGGAQALLPAGFFGPVRPKGFSLVRYEGNAKHFDNLSTDFTGSLAQSGKMTTVALGATGSGTSAHAELGIVEAVKFVFPKLQYRSAGTDGGSADQFRVYWGIRPKLSTTSTTNDPDYCDYLRSMGMGLGDEGNHVVQNEDLYEYSNIFTLDDIVITPGNDVSYASGSYNSSKTDGQSYTNVSGNFGGLLDLNVRQFLMPIWGGFDGLDITRPEPFRNANIATGGSLDTKNNYLDYTISKALDSVLDDEVVAGNLILMPGITKAAATNKMISVAEKRQDLLAIIDIENDYTPRAESSDTAANRLGSVTSAISTIKARNLNSSFACTFYPWVQVADNINGGQYVWLPSSVAALGAFAKSQSQSDVWFAPAGFNRGGLGNLGGRRGPRVVQARQRLDSSERDKLYEQNINPIATFPAEGVVVFGQKTLQADQSALDRINVRRLVLLLKSKVGAVARNLLFDNNVESTWLRFTSQVEPILSDIRARFGLTDYKVVLDSTTTTPDLIDRNIMYAKIYIKPARAIEYIVVDFVITKTGADFV